MTESLTKAKCHRSECSHFLENPEDSLHIWCTHPDKPHYLKTFPCPLFRLDLRRQKELEGSGAAPDLLKLIRRR